MAGLAERFAPGRERAAGRGPRGRRVGRRTMGFLAAALGLGAVAGGALYLRLAHGPLPLEAGARWAEAALAREAPGLRLAIGGLALGLDPQRGGPSLLVSDVALRDASGVELVAAPAARLTFAALDLLAGRLRPTSIELSGASAVLRRSPSGRFALAVADSGDRAAVADAGFGAVAAALDAWEAGAPGPLAALRDIALTEASLRYEDAAAGRVWRGSEAALRVTRARGGALSATASARLDGGAFGPTRVSADGRREADGGAALRLAVSGAEPAALADQFPALDALRALRAPLRGELRARIDGAGALREFDGRLRIGAGALDLPRVAGDAGDAAVALNGGALDLGYDPELGRYDIRRAEIDAAPGAVALSGFVDLERGADGPRAATGQIELDALELRDPALFAAPVAFDGGGAMFSLDLAARSLQAIGVRLERGGLTLHGEGRAALGAEGGWSAEGALRGRDLDAATLVALWPVAAAPGARDWVRDNLESGVVEEFEIAGGAAPGGEALSVAFAFRDATAHYLRPMPPIEGGAGWGAASLDSFGIALTEGRVRTPSGGGVSLTGAALRLPDLDDPRANSVVEIAGRGEISALLDLIDAEPLALPSKLDIDPLSVGGTAEVRAWLTLPLVRDLALEEVGVDVEAALAEVDFAPPGLGATLRAPQATLTANAARMRVAGAGALAFPAAGAAPLRFDWTETFSPGPGAPSTRVALGAEATPARAAAFGLDLDAWREGAIGVEAELALGPGGAAEFDARLDLARAALTASALGWAKEAGAPGAARLAGRSDGALALDRVEIDAPGLSLRGAARLDADGELETLDLARLRLGPRTDVALRARRGADGLTAEVRGARLDLASLGDREAAEGQAGEAGPALSVDLAVDRLDLTEALSLRSARGSVTRSARGEIAARLDGALAGAVGAPAAASLRFEGSEAGGVARIAAPDGGAFLRAAGLFGDAMGGTLEAEARVALGGALSVEGRASLRDVTVIDDAPLRAMLAEARLDAAQARLESEGGLDFDAVRADFALAGGALRLTDFVATGPTIGLTMQGGYDLAADRLDMTGVFTPLYQINSALGAIPLLGALLTGGQGEGLIAFNFALSGPSAAPEVRMNPLSAFTPGAFRKILDLGAEAPDPEAEATRARRERDR